MATDNATTNVTDNVTAIQDQFLGLVRDGQETVVKAVQSWADTVTNAAPRNGDLPFADLPFADFPFADAYPQPAEAVDQAFAFSEQLLVTQREFAKNVWAAAQPVWNLAEKQAGQGSAGTRSATKA